jgi:hypothetical protein
MALQPEGKGRVGRNKRRWKDRIKINLRGPGMLCPNYMLRYRDQLHSLVNTVMNTSAPYKVSTLLTS